MWKCGESENHVQIEKLNQREIEIVRLKVERLSNPQIGNQLHLSTNTIRWYVSEIYSKLAVGSVDELIERTEELQLFAESTPNDASTNHDHTPNPLTSFIGRHREVAEIRKLLTRTRLITLTGTGGTGKTRLALKSVETLHTKFLDGVYFVNLAPLSNPHNVAKTIADTLELVAPQNGSVIDSLIRALKNKHCLLILDNFEQVISAATLVSDLLSALPKLHILVTSREALQLYGEHEYAVLPLPLVTFAQNQSLQQFADNEAIQLFVERARSVVRQFQLTEANVQAVAAICARLDGLPLAIELAAVQIKLLNPDAILNRMDNRLDGLKGHARDLPERQQTIRNTIAWSYDLLNDEERTLFARLAVFRGGRSLDAIEAVCLEDFETDVFEILASLVNKNLVRQYPDPAGEPRFWMLETIQEFALDCLEASGSADSIRRRHAEYFCRLAEQAKPELQRVNQAVWYKRLEIELDNLRTVLGWTLQGADPEPGIKLLIDLDDFWRLRIYQVECDHWLQLAREYIDEIAPEYRYGLYSLLAMPCWRLRNDYLEARHYTSLAIDIARELDNKLWIATSLRELANYEFARPPELETELPVDDALELLDEAIRLMREHGYLVELARTLNTKARLLGMKGDIVGQIECTEDCIAIARQAGDIRSIYVNINNRAAQLREIGDHEQATVFAKEALKLEREAGDRFLMACTINFAFDPVEEAQHAVRMHAAFDAALEAMGTTGQPGTGDNHLSRLVLMRKHLSEEDFEKAWNDGISMSLEEAVRYALGEDRR